MLRSLSRGHVTAAAQLRETRRFSTSTVSRSQLPNARLELDSSFDEFMNNNKELGSWKAQLKRDAMDAHASRRAPRELEVFPDDPSTVADYLSSEELDNLEVAEDRHTRKSPAAHFGSQRHGTIVMPFELQGTITKLISGMEKQPLPVPQSD